jgi:mono/diheme cytochrome c family protein
MQIMFSIIFPKTHEKKGTIMKNDLLPTIPSRHGSRSGWGGRTRVAAACVASALALAGCAVEVLNTQAAEELARQSAPPGSVYLGWRVFQDRCARCHGPDALGSSGAPDLLPIVRDMGPRRFVGLVLRRYDMDAPTSLSSAAGAAREAWIDSVVARNVEPLTMPAWGGEPRVSAHTVDLHS